MHTGVEQLNTWMVAGGSQGFHRWDGSLQTSMRSMPEWPMWHWISVRGTMFSLIYLQADTYPNSYTYADIPSLVYILIFPPSVRWEGLEAMTLQWPWALSVPISWFLIPFSNKRSEASLKKWLLLSCSKKYTRWPCSILQCWKMRSCSKKPQWNGYVKGTGAKQKGPQWPKLEQFEWKINKGTLNDHSKYKVNIHEPVLIWINDWRNR